MGTVCTNCPVLSERIHYMHKCIGAIPSPFDCFLMIRSIKTLSIRLERINFNALKVAEFLSKHNKIEKVIYAGLPTHKDHELQKSQLRKGLGVGFGGVVTIYVKGNITETCSFMTNLKVFTLAESLGAVESLANHPAIMTHSSVDPEVRKELEIYDHMVRLSVGIEDIEDLLKDLDQALNNMSSKPRVKF